MTEVNVETMEPGQHVEYRRHDGTVVATVERFRRRSGKYDLRVAGELVQFVEFGAGLGQCCPFGWLPPEEPPRALDAAAPPALRPRRLVPLWQPVVLSVVLSTLASLVTAAATWSFLQP